MSLNVWPSCFKWIKKKQLKVLICSIIVFHQGVGGPPDFKILSSMWLRLLFTFRKFALHFIWTHKHIPKHRYYSQSLPTSIHIDTVSFRSSVFFLQALHKTAVIFQGEPRFRSRQVVSYLYKACKGKLFLWTCSMMWKIITQWNFHTYSFRIDLTSTYLYIKLTHIKEI